jgi:hypothetical protein
VAVQTDEGFFDAEMVEEKSAVTGVLGGDEIGGAEGFDGAQRDVLAVADGCWNDAQHENFARITNLR